MVLERAPVHDVHGRHRPPGPPFTEGAFDTFEVLADFEQLAVLLTGGPDELVQHGDDRPTDDPARGLGADAGDAVVQGGEVDVHTGAHRVVHRLWISFPLGVQQVRAHLTCDDAVAQQHRDVEDGTPREDTHRAGLGTQPTEVLEGPQCGPCQQPVSVGLEFLPVVLHQ